MNWAVWVFKLTEEFKFRRFNDLVGFGVFQCTGYVWVFHCTGWYDVQMYKVVLVYQWVSWFWILFVVWMIVGI